MGARLEGAAVGQLNDVVGAGEGEVGPALGDVEGVAAEPVAERADHPVG